MLTSLLPGSLSLASRSPSANYWDNATRQGLAVLARDTAKAMQARADALPSARETFEAETTARNVRLIREARGRRGDPVEPETAVEAELAAWTK